MEMVRVCRLQGKEVCAVCSTCSVLADLVLEYRQKTSTVWFVWWSITRFVYGTGDSLGEVSGSELITHTHKFYCEISLQLLYTDI